MAISRSFLLKIRNVSEKLFIEGQNTHFTFNNFFPEYRAVYEIMWKNLVQPDRPQMTNWRMRVACSVPKPTNTHSEYVILIALPPQQCLNESASILLYTYIICLVYCCHVYQLTVQVIPFYVFLDTTTLAEVFPCFYPSCKANARV